MKLSFYSKLIIVTLFIAISIIEIYFHSERWNSLIDGILFIVKGDNYENDHIHTLNTINWIIAPILSVLFLVISNKWSNITFILLIIAYCLMILPTYIEHPELIF